MRPLGGVCEAGMGSCDGLRTAGPRVCKADYLDESYDYGIFWWEGRLRVQKGTGGRCAISGGCIHRRTGQEVRTLQSGGVQQEK